MDDKEIGQMSDTNNTSAVKLLSHPTAAKVPNRKDTLLQMRPLYTADIPMAGREVLKNLAHACKECNIQDNDTLFKAGEEAQYWYILVRGRMREHWEIHEADDESGSLPPLDCLGLTDCIRGGQYNTTTVAVGLCVVYALDIGRTKELMEESPAVNNFVMHLCTESLIRTKLEKFSGLSRYETQKMVTSGNLHRGQGQHEMQTFDERIIVLQGTVLSGNSAEGEQVELFTVLENGAYFIIADATVFELPELTEDAEGNLKPLVSQRSSIGEAVMIRR